MAYKVNYYTLAILADGGIGNIRMSTGHVYTDKNIADIPAALNEYLKHKERVGIIEKIETVGGVCI